MALLWLALGDPWCANQQQRLHSLRQSRPSTTACHKGEPAHIHHSENTSKRENPNRVITTACLRDSLKEWAIRDRNLPLAAQRKPLDHTVLCLQTDSISQKRGILRKAYSSS